jgi:hypothetical protein
MRTFNFNGKEFSQSKMYALLVIILVVAVLFIILLNSPMGEGYYGIGSGAPYATLGSYGYTEPLFEPDVLRRCASGSYMYSSNPELTSFCSTVPPQVLDRVACAGAFRGRPLHLQYTAPAYGTCNKLACGAMEPSLVLS